MDPSMKKKQDYSGLSAEERACILGRKLREMVAAGEFRLGFGYLDAKPDGTECEGCAIAAAAKCLGAIGVVKSGTYASGTRIYYGARDLRNFLVSRDHGNGLLAMLDVYQLEAGYEATKILPGGLPADPDDPFFKLGKAMAISAGHNRTELYAARCLVSKEAIK